MQGKVYKYFEKHVKEKELGDKKVLDVGSLHINGSLKPLFTDYTGLDMRAGKNVDVVANAHKIPFEDESFEVVTCAEMLEHDDCPFITMGEIYRVLKPEGWCILAASGIYFRKHEHPADYWRFTAEGMGVLLKQFENVETHEDRDEAYGIGQKLCNFSQQLASRQAVTANG